jgi:NAD(P)-dependent dehydrogenase (short-subunit alcohol dehydrogenase family)
LTFNPVSAFDLSGQVALVTGGSRGLGRAMADGFAAAGADLVIASRNAQACEQAAAEITARTGRAAMPYPAHVGHWDELDGLVNAVYGRFGRLDVLVNNAGMSPRYERVDTVTEELFDKVVAVNMKGPFRLAALAGARMAAGQGGSIINITSTGADRPRPDIVPYAAAKAGLTAITIGLAHAFGPTVRCNAIMAGTFLTDVSASWDMDAFRARAEGFALGRGGQPEEIVGAALYLASAAASYTTGAVLRIDGGQP